MSQLRVAMGGAGFWAQYQLAAWHEVDGVRCVAVCDPDRARAEQLASRWGVPAAFDDAVRMLDQTRPDVLDIVASVSAHAPLVHLAANRRIPVICQKPMAPTWAECEAMAAACSNAGVFFAVHENWRWQSPLRRVKELLDSGTIGAPYRARIDMLTGFDVFANQPSLRLQKELIIADLGCHLIDLARCYFGEADSIDAHTWTVRSDVSGEDAATLILRMNAGRTLVTLNMAYAGTPLEHDFFPQTLVFIEGERGSIEVAPDYHVRVTRSSPRSSRRRTPT
jgi:predicted dehydrogenase